MFQQLKKIYNFFEDEESKTIFKFKLLHGLTDDWKYIKEMLLFYRKENKEYYDILDVLANPELFINKEIILFGTGFYGPCVVNWLKYCGLEYNFFCDNNSRKTGKEFLGKKIISPQELFAEHRNALVFISTETYEQEIIKQLQENNFPDKQIIRLSSFTKDKMYIDDEIMKPKKNEIYIDGGSYDGKNSLEFINWTGEENVQKIYAFEPDYNNYVECQKILKEKCKVNYEVLQFGLWSKKTTLPFVDELGERSFLDNSGKSKIPMISIDEVVGDDKVSFIKMDIEGAELEALKGAAKTIKNNKPRLAICLYHKKEDIVEIPKYIKELVPEYKLYIRHYGPYIVDTVLYAVLE